METTLNIHNDVLLLIEEAAQVLGISRSALITIIIKKLMDDIQNPAQLGTLVRYQGRSGQEDWHTFHIKLRMDDYEFFLDLRKLLKMSVSLILSYAVKKFLVKIIKLNITDNYRYKNYIVVREIIDDIVSWRLIWGYPPGIGKIIS
jgi:hypothetical protein